ncbi:MAG: hypothetical protein EBQ66_10280 [Flavobacteriia bacterium]|nr:hypothetical protein [Flavobacteriia bacterium]NBY41246.1 hypothetical protein [Flavobacteriia bacterium]
MKIVTTLAIAVITISLTTSCEEKLSKNFSDKEDLTKTTNDDDTDSLLAPDSISLSDADQNEVNENLVKYEKYTFPKRYTEESLEKGPSDILDFRDRDDDKFIGIKFSDGREGTLVMRNNNYYNYTIREKTEVQFATKNDGLQRIWDNCIALEKGGAAIGSAFARKSGPRKKDGTPDMRYKANQ